MKSCRTGTSLPWLMYLLATLFYLYEFLLRVSPNVLAEHLISEFSMDARQFGLFSSLYYWAYAPLQLPVGGMTDNYGPRRLLTLAVVLCGVSTLVLVFTHSFFMGCVARVLIGIGSAFAFICCVKITQIWFPPHLFPFLTGLTLAIGTFGAALGGTPMSFALNFIEWRTLMAIMGVAGLLLALAIWLIVKDKPDQKQHTHHYHHNACVDVGVWNCLKRIAQKPQIWLVGIYAFFVTAPTDAFGGAWGVKFLMEVHHFSRDSASFAAVSMTFIGMALGSPFLGGVSSYFDSRKIPMAIAGIIAACALTMIILLPKLTLFSAPILFFLFGASGTYVLAFVAVRMVTSSDYVATAVGFVNMLSIFGSALVTFSVGWMLDYFRSGLVNEFAEPIYLPQDFQYSLIILPVFYLMSALIVVPLLKEKKEY